MKHEEQLLDIISLTLLCLIFCLKASRLLSSLILLSNFDHNNGPKYLKECFPYLTELNLGSS